MTWCGGITLVKTLMAIIDLPVDRYIKATDVLGVSLAFSIVLLSGDTLRTLFHHHLFVRL